MEMVVSKGKMRAIYGSDVLHSPKVQSTYDMT